MPGRRRAVRAIARTVVALASASALVVAGLAWALQHRVQDALVTSDATVPQTPVVAGESFTALLVGLDARTDASGNPLPAELLDKMHAGPDEGQLHTDTIILLHVPGDPAKAPVALSIPRDSYVPIAGGRGTHKINSAYWRGVREAQQELARQGVTGPELDRRTREKGRAVLVETVENLTGVTVDHFAEINLAGFVELTEALGGVPVCLAAPARDSYSGLDLPAGRQTVSGATALAFVRQRHGLTGGDLDRIGRQQAFLAGLVQQLRTTGALTDPDRLAELVGIVTRHVVLDSSWDIPQVVAQVQALQMDELTLHTIPTGRPDLPTPADGIAVQIDRTAVREFATALLSDEPEIAATTVAAPEPLAVTSAPAPTTTSSVSPSPTAPMTPIPTTTARVISADEVPCVP
ncbi:transcriptional attenuator, LytR family [Pseudonocardia thermophila]|uniref:Transcriptional attenuator, LytR family n=1 Tax=Pseudonocardia thermophila TaxID=1848 RepID=A0A1M6U4U6_PSETH|nr:LCP family protein [Pseudonocardia thermophila]SHK64206.1 transcriptional attenuator, LytR family [Pseudonocardia thermophila]